jgi:hypothetical protein
LSAELTVYPGEETAPTTGSHFFFVFASAADITRGMRHVRDWLLLFGTSAVLLFSAVMAVRQFSVNQSNHAEMREALIFLHERGYNTEAQKVYTQLLLRIEKEPTRHLVDDLQRTSGVAPTNQSASTNVLVRYHLSVKKELEKRFQKEYLNAHTVAKVAP